MMTVRCLFAVGLLGLMNPSLHAHHSHASLDSSRIETWEGVIIEYAWRSPHVYFRIAAPNAAGDQVEYAVEVLNPTAMSRLGWGPDTFARGDRIRWSGNPDRDPNRYYTGLNWAETTDGIRMYGDTETAAAENAVLADAAPVMPAAAIGEGNWRRIAPDGSRHPFIRSPSDDWPLNARGQELVDNFNEDDNPFNARCEYAGPPRAIYSVYGHVWSRPDADKIYIWENMNPAPREIHLNEDAPRGEPSVQGHSVGYFDADGQLHVTTDNFVDTQWGHYTGIDSSDQKKLTERYWLSEGGMRLNVEVTVEDPVWLSEPYVFTHQWRKQPDAPVIDAECTLEAANFYLTAGFDSPAASNDADDGNGADDSTPLSEWLFYAALLAAGVLIVTAGIRRR
jgi:hypothetical protein